MEGKAMEYVNHEQCEHYRREVKEDLHCLKADSQRTDDMITDEMRGMRQDLNKNLSMTNEFINKVTELIVRREEDEKRRLDEEKRKTKTESRFYWIAGFILSVIGLLITLKISGLI